MANFSIFFPILENQEGLYANTLGDSGGETWKGISRNNYPAWSGWGLIDSHRPAGGFVSSTQANAILKILPDLQAKVVTFYKTSQWDTIGGDYISNQSIANYLADWGVNAGNSVPVKHVQRIIGTNVDGKMGPATLAAINAADGSSLFEGLKADRIQFYKDVVAAHPVDAKFLNTWLTRANSFTYQP